MLRSPPELRKRRRKLRKEKVRRFPLNSQQERAQWDERKIRVATDRQQVFSLVLSWTISLSHIDRLTFHVSIGPRTPMNARSLAPFARAHAELGRIVLGAARSISMLAAQSSTRVRFFPDVIVKPDLPKSATSGVLLVFGQGDVGQLGLGQDVVEKMRAAAVPVDDVVAIAAGGMHTICIRKTGEVVTFGCNDEGALGRDTSKEGSEAVPGVVALSGKAIQVTAGDSHSAALLEDGKVFAWGSFRDSHGSMGLTLNGNERVPTEILSGIEIAKIASGADHLVLLSKNGRVYTCGCGEQGQLGHVTARSSGRYNRQGISSLLTPGLVTFKVRTKTVIADIWAGTYCTFAREYYTGDIYVFGLNNYHQLGLKEPTTHFRPQISKTFSGKVWKSISGGQHHTVALNDAGEVYVMGRKEYGRLGLGSGCTDATELMAVPALNSLKCVDVAAGSAQTFAVTDSGHLYAWGMGTSGQLGTGEEEDVEEPVQVKGKQLLEKSVVRVAGGGQHTVVLATVKAA